MTSTAFAAGLILVSIIGLTLNIYILVVVLLTRQVSSANNLLLLHLGVVDTLLGVLFLSFSGPGLTKENWFSIGPPCAFHGFLFTLLHPLLLWTVCGLNCDRYYAIASPLHYGHLVNSKKILLGLGVGWTVSLALCVPPLFTIAPYRYIEGLGACAPDFSGNGTLWYSAVYTAITLLLPATLIICCNMKILMIARYHRHRIASAIYEVTLSAQVTITHQRNPFFVPTVTAPSAGGPKFRGRSAWYSVLQLLGSFTILYFPYYIVIMWQSSITLLSPSNNFHKSIHPHFFSIIFTLLTCSPSINGFLYGVKNKTIRKSFQNYWRKKLSKNEMNQEIQARTPSTCGSRRQSLTPLGFLSKPTLQRRLSEALLEVQKSPQRSKIKRIASESTWKKDSSGSLNLSPTNPRKIIQAKSCNTLEVPKISDEFSEKLSQQLSMVNENSSTKPSNILQKFFLVEDQPQKEINSPKILITRAFSEESDKNSPPKDIHKTHSTTSLLEKKWKSYFYQQGEEEEEKTMKPLLQSESEPLKEISENGIRKNNFQKTQEVIL
ncbi:histamine H2 receptor-like [Onthophagus taurus]|uniref:histamine H2 receptor-like n=1 Tax=Onthophagus taurus TaxID=166361 RepID=UPI000C2053A2|nr:histamine H2 receptor-like [Onthophagus taurus]XP_022916481.1 histamine H2 receptor-like [Onthophagus taurus]